jgi:hypothetical protein
VGWNEARVTLTPPRWRQTIKKVKKRRAEGEREFFLRYPEREPDVADGPLLPETARNVLEQLGGVIRQQSDTLLDVRLQDVIVLVFIDSGEVAEMELTFVLTADFQGRVASWQAVVEQMCERLSLAIWDSSSRSKANCCHFDRILRSTQAWDDFQANYGSKKI